MFKVEHRHGNITHIHFGGDIEHNHPSEGGFVLSQSLEVKQPLVKKKTAKKKRR